MWGVATKARSLCEAQGQQNLFKGTQSAAVWINFAHQPLSVVEFQTEKITFDLFPHLNSILI